MNVDQCTARSADIQCQPPGGISLQQILNTCTLIYIGMQVLKKCIVTKAEHYYGSVLTAYSYYIAHCIYDNSVCRYQWLAATSDSSHMVSVIPLHTHIHW